MINERDIRYHIYRDGSPESYLQIVHLRTGLAVHMTHKSYTVAREILLAQLEEKLLCRVAPETTDTRGYGGTMRRKLVEAN